MTQKALEEFLWLLRTNAALGDLLEGAGHRLRIRDASRRRTLVPSPISNQVCIVLWNSSLGKWTRFAVRYSLGEVSEMYFPEVFGRRDPRNNPTSNQNRKDE